MSTEKCPWLDARGECNFRVCFSIACPDHFCDIFLFLKVFEWLVDRFFLRRAESNVKTLKIRNYWGQCVEYFDNFWHANVQKNSLIRTPSGLGKMSGLEWILVWGVF